MSLLLSLLALIPPSAQEPVPVQEPTASQEQANTIAQLGQLGDQGGDLFFPLAASDAAEVHDEVYYIVFWISVFFLFLICFATIYFAFKYNRSKSLEPQKSPPHNDLIEIVWTVIPTLICVYLFWIGMVGYVDRRTPPADTYDIYVTGQKWSWTFAYPNGAISNELHAPVGRPVRLILSSKDVLHSVFIPVLRLKMDAVPGRFEEMWFEAREIGEFEMFCTEYCGTNHSAMLAKLVLETPTDHQIWVDENSDPTAGLTPVEAGNKLRTVRGCVACHNVTGAPGGIGPTWKGSFGANQVFADGSTGVVDETYIRQSILEPNAKIVEGFASPSQMPSYQGQLNDAELQGLIEYIKTLQ